jgi:hypothetical protein
MPLITNGSVYYPGLRDGVPFFKPFDYVSVGTVDFQTLNYLEDPHEDLTCAICYGPFVDPVVTNCKHTFCRECMSSVFDFIPVTDDVPCPMCRAAISDDAPVQTSSEELLNTVNALVVACPQSFRGCAAQLPRGRVEGHCRYQCAFGYYKEPNDRKVRPRLSKKWRIIKTPAGEIHERRRAGLMNWDD